MNARVKPDEGSPAVDVRSGVSPGETARGAAGASGAARGPARHFDRVAALDWGSLAGELGSHGSALVERLLEPEECRFLAALYAQDNRFRSRVVMSRHGFGRGEYKYFSYPLPQTVSQLRTTLYPWLAPIANRWN